MVTKTIMCPRCKSKVTIQVNPGEKMYITCPKCNTKGVFTFTEERKIIKIPDTQFAFIIITLISLILVFTVIMHLNWEVFIILIFIGLLVIKEIFSGYTTPNIKERLNIFIILFIIAFILIVVNKVMDLSGI